MKEVPENPMFSFESMSHFVGKRVKYVLPLEWWQSYRPEDLKKIDTNNPPVFEDTIEEDPENRDWYYVKSTNTPDATGPEVNVRGAHHIDKYLIELI